MCSALFWKESLPPYASLSEVDQGMSLNVFQHEDLGKDLPYHVLLGGLICPLLGSSYLEMEPCWC